MFKLCDCTGYTYDMNVYLGKDRQRAAQHLTATHATVINLARGVEGCGHKLYWTASFPPLSSLMTWLRKNADRMANSYTVSRRTWKWTKKTLFRPVRPDHCQQLHPLIFMWWEEIFDSPLSERCSHGLGMSHDHPCLQGDQPQLLITPEDWTHVTISTGLAAVTRNGDVACVLWGGP